MWCTVPDLLNSTCFIQYIKFIHFTQVVTICHIVSIATILTYWWHDGIPPERPPYIPKRIRRKKRLSDQYCQILKSWIHTVRSSLFKTKISASDQIIKLHLKLQGVILSYRNSRQLHLRKLLAFKHHNQAFLKPRVRFRKAQYIFPLLCLTSIVIANASTQPSHDGIQVKANFDTDSLDFGIDNRCSACILT